MLNLKIISPEKLLFDQEVYEVMLPTPNGQIAILPGHQSLVTILKPGVISIRKYKNDPNEQLDHLATSGGFVEVTKNNVKLMADSAQRADDIDELKISEAREEAKRQLLESSDQIASAAATARLETELAKEKVKQIKRKHGSRTAINQDSSI